MSIDRLQDKIRKMKNPSAWLVEPVPDVLPNALLEQEGTLTAACLKYFPALLEALKDVIPCVRFGFAGFAMLGEQGIGLLRTCLSQATDLGYYVLLDLPELWTPSAAKYAADSLAESDIYRFDGVVINGYPGTDILKPMASLCGAGKSVFVLDRTANRSAGELFDLMTGGRLVHTAAADVINRVGESYFGKCGYSNMGALAAASSADSLRTLRTRYNRLFLLIDGYDYPNANAKNCSFAFDQFGHGAIACAASGISAAWKEAESLDPVEAAVAAAERMKKNLTRYVVIL